MLASLRIHWKLTLLSATFLVPIALLTWLLIVQSYKDINFATKEQEGSRYLAALREVTAALAVADARTAAKALAAVEQIDREVGGGMALDDLPAALANDVRRAERDGWAATGPQALARAQALIARVGDGSNLILDPDLDSYYTMDLVVVKLPLAAVQSLKVLDSAARVAVLDLPPFQDMMALRTDIGEFSSALTGIATAIDSAERGSLDGSLKAAFAAPFTRVQKAAQAYVGELETLSASLSLPAVARKDHAILKRLQAEFVAESRAAWDIASGELDRLLAARISGFQKKLWWSLGSSAVVLILGALLALMIARSISRPMAELVAVMRTMAAGDLAIEVPGCDRGDEAGALATAADEMRRQLNVLATQVRANALLVHQAAQKIAGAVEAQAAASSEMSASVSEITSTMEELSASSTQIAEHSGSVVDFANLTWEHSKKGSEAMQQVTAKMADIQGDNQTSLREIIDLGTKSKEISKVMKIINAIADQTKLIAFNAALESASAGEAGRRFGVVAAEIRRLADSVTDSTSEIETKVGQIQDSIDRLVITSDKGAAGISSGMAATTHTAQRLGELVGAAQQTTSAAKQISLSTQQQKTASGQVVVALREIVSASNHTAQSIANISQISKDMTHLSAELDTHVGRFRLAETAEPAATAAQSAPAGT